MKLFVWAVVECEGDFGGVPESIVKENADRLAKETLLKVFRGTEALTVRVTSDVSNPQGGRP